MRAVHRVYSAENDRLDFFISGTRRTCRIIGKRNCVAGSAVGNVFYASANIAYFARLQTVCGNGLGLKYTHFHNIILLAVAHDLHTVAHFYFSVLNPDKADCAFIIIVIRVEYKCFKRCVYVAFGSGHHRYDLIENVLYSDAFLCAYKRSHRRVYTDYVLDFRAYFFGACGRQIYFVDNRQNFKVVVNRNIYVCKRLRFHALRRIHDKHCAFASGKRPGNFIRKVDMPRRIYKIKFVVHSVQSIIHLNGSKFYSYASFAFDIHRIEQLFGKLAFGKRAGILDKSVGKS